MELPLFVQHIAYKMPLKCPKSTIAAYKQSDLKIQAYAFTTAEISGEPSMASASVGSADMA